MEETHSGEISNVAVNDDVGIWCEVVDRGECVGLDDNDRATCSGLCWNSNKTD